MAVSRDLLDELRQLGRTEKLRIVQMLVNELAAEEEVLLTAEVQYDIWSPYDAADAASTLLAIEEDDISQVQPT